MLSRLLGIISIPALLCTIWSLSTQEYDQASLFALVFILLSVLAGVIFVATAKGDTQAGLRETIAFLFCLWLIVSIVGLIPFYLVTGGNLPLALFESVSCVTTTGTSLAPADQPLEASIIVWRGLLHLIGAGLSIAGTIALLSMLGAGGSGVRYSAAIHLGFRLHFESFPKLFLLISTLLATIAAITFVALLSDGLAAREAFSLAVGAATTGQILPYDAGALVATRWTGILLSVVLIFASLNVGLILALRSHPRNLLTDNETIGIICAFLILFGVLAVSQKMTPYLTSFTDAASIVSTSGLMLSEEQSGRIGVPLMIFFGFVGGSAVSATGGIKMFRFWLLIRRTTREFAQLSQPHAILGKRNRYDESSVQVVMAVWVYLVGFALVISALASYLAIMGLDFNESLQVAVGTFTNSAALFRAEMLGDQNETITQLILTFGMIFGRLEMLILISLIFRA